ncbi:MAG: transposase, partial [Acidobacteria bacterium]|nr:transposase [Acidobacteriota bacterium]
MDLGVTTLAVLSTGERIPGPKAYRRRLAALRRSSRALSRKRKGSANRRKAQVRLARVHARTANIRRDVTHKATTRLARGWRRIVIEDLNVRGMAADRRLALSVMDGGFQEFRRQLVYKAA